MPLFPLFREEVLTGILWQYVLLIRCLAPHPHLWTYPGHYLLLNSETILDSEEGNAVK